MTKEELIGEAIHRAMMGASNGAVWVPEVWNLIKKEAVDKVLELTEEK